MWGELANVSFKPEVVNSGDMRRTKTPGEDGSIWGEDGCQIGDLFVNVAAAPKSSLNSMGDWPGIWRRLIHPDGK